MGDLRHPNIVCLLGVVTQEEPRCLLFEHMSQGDLHEFLISHSPRADPALASFILQGNEMLFIATQIAAGMEYLAAHHYVHRFNLLFIRTYNFCGKINVLKFLIIARVGILLQEMLSWETD